MLGTARAGSSRLELLKPNGFFVLSTNQNNKIKVLKSLTRNSTLHLQGFLNSFCVSFCVEQVRVSPPFLTVSVSLCYTPGFYFLAQSYCKLFLCHIVIVNAILIVIVTVILSFISIRARRNFSIPEILVRVSFIFSRSTTRNDFLKSRSRLETQNNNM